MTQELPDNSADVQPGLVNHSSDPARPVCGAPADCLAMLLAAGRCCVSAHPWLALGAGVALGLVMGGSASRRCARQHARRVPRDTEASQ